jgi:hypothetical protein
MRFTPNNITKLKPYEIFVFGSNEAGIHGAGAARVANKLFGAEFGKGFGRTGQTYAIPTKNHMIKTLSLPAIEKYVKQFIEESKNYSYLTFLVTEIGCGLAGYTPKDIAPMFKDAPENIVLPETFWKILNEK